MKFLVTGATGFIGAALCAQIRQADHELLAYSARGLPLADGTPTRPLNFADRQIDAEEMADVDVVVHLAGIAHRRAAEADYLAVNHLAAVELAQRAAGAGVGSFIFLSSVKAMGQGDGDVPRAEADCVAPGDAYGQSKRDAELAFGKAFGSGDMSVTVLRPALVYGEGAGGNLALLSRAVDRGLPRPPADGGRSMIGRDDLCQLILLLAAKNAPGVRTYIAADGELYSTRRIYDALRRARGMQPGRAWCPRWGWQVACRLIDLVAGNPEPAWQRLFGWERYSNLAARQELGWLPQQTFEGSLVCSGAMG